MRLALQHLQSLLGNCIKFKEQSYSKDSLMVVDEDGHACHSSLGYQPNYNYNDYDISGKIALAPDRCFKSGVGVIQHEFLHALGLSHEHQREDRDNYVTIHWDNIEDGMARNFEKCNKNQCQRFGLEYDYLSVMHYQKDTLSKGGNTITAGGNMHIAGLDEVAMTEKLGNGFAGPNIHDINLVQYFYNCPG